MKLIIMKIKMMMIIIVNIYIQVNINSLTIKICLKIRYLQNYGEIFIKAFLSIYKKEDSGERRKLHVKSKLRARLRQSHLTTHIKNKP